MNIDHDEEVQMNIDHEKEVQMNIDHEKEVQAAFFTCKKMNIDTTTLSLVIKKDKTIDDIKKIVENLIKFHLDHTNFKIWMDFSFVRPIYVKYIGFAMPSEEAIQIIKEHTLNWFKEHSDAKFIDMGAGTGVWDMLLHDAGIDKNKLIAVDVPTDNKTHNFIEKFWPILEVNDYDDIQENDILFVAWGYFNIEKYITKTKCVIIIGENMNGCTHPSGDYFDDDDNWIVNKYKIPGSATYYDILSINIRV